MSASLIGFCSEENYQLLPGIRSSVLSLGMSSMAELREAISQGGGTKKSTPEMEFGTYVHDLILVPNLIKDRYFFPGEDKKQQEGSGKGSKAAMLEQAERVKVLADGRPIIWPVQEQIALIMAERVMREIEKWQKLQMMSVECAIRFECHGIPLKVRIDAIGTGGDEPDVILDIKTTRRPDPWGFSKDVHSKLYWFQAGMQAMAVEQLTGNVPKYLWIAIGKHPPYMAQEYSLGGSDLERAMKRVEQVCKDYAACKDKPTEHRYATNGKPVAIALAPYVDLPGMPGEYDDNNDDVEFT